MVLSEGVIEGFDPEAHWIWAVITGYLVFGFCCCGATQYSLHYISRHLQIRDGSVWSTCVWLSIAIVSVLVVLSLGLALLGVYEMRREMANPMGIARDLVIYACIFMAVFVATTVRGFRRLEQGMDL